MKHKSPILAFLLLALPVFLPAQSNRIYEFASPGINAGWPIVRPYDASRHLTRYISSDGRHHFALMYNDPTVADTFDIPYEIEILDFRVMNDVIYYCGKLRGGRTGVIGNAYINIPSAGMVSYNYFTSRHVEKYSRMVVYEDETTDAPRSRLVAIGEGSFPEGYAYAVTYIADAEGINITNNVKTRPMRRNENGMEMLEDICVVGQNIIIAGKNSDSENIGLILHKTTLANPLGTALDDIYRYPGAGTIADLRLTPSQQGDFMVAYRHQDSLHNDFTVLRAFKGQDLYNYCSQRYQKPLKGSVWDVIYMPVDHSCVLLENWADSTNNTWVVYLWYCATGVYQAPILSRSDYHFFSLARADNSHYLTSGITNCWMYWDKTLPPFYTQCFPSKWINVFPLPNEEFFHHIYSTEIYLESIENDGEGYMNQTSIQTICR